MSVYTTVFAGSTPIGAPIIGWLASTFSTEVALAAGGGIAVVAALAAGAWVIRGGLSAAPSGPDRRAPEEATAVSVPEVA